MQTYIILFAFLTATLLNAATDQEDGELSAPAPAPAVAATPNLRANTQGFYPLWENTGYIQPQNEIFLATTGFQFGFENIGQVGTMPISYFYRSPNLYVKMKLLDDPDGKWQLAVQGNLYYVMPGGARSMFSPVYTSRIDNSDLGFGMIPVAAAGSYQVRPWWTLHGTATLMTIVGGGIQNGIEPGLSVVSEFRALNLHSLLIHLGEVGGWRHDFLYLGTSYRYRSDSFELRFGYFYRVFALGSQGGPLIGAGFVL